MSRFGVPIFNEALLTVSSMLWETPGDLLEPERLRPNGLGLPEILEWLVLTDEPEVLASLS